MPHCLDCAPRYEIDALRAAFEARREGAALRPLRRLRQDRHRLVRPVDAAERRCARAEAETLAADLFIVVGSSLVVYPAAGFPELAKRNGAALAIVNRDPTHLDALADVVVNRPIGEALGIGRRGRRDQAGTLALTRLNVAWPGNWLLSPGAIWYCMR